MSLFLRIGADILKVWHRCSRRLHKAIWPSLEAQRSTNKIDWEKGEWPGSSSWQRYRNWSQQFGFRCHRRDIHNFDLSHLQTRPSSRITGTFTERVEKRCECWWVSYAQGSVQPTFLKRDHQRKPAALPSFTKWSAENHPTGGESNRRRIRSRKSKSCCPISHLPSKKDWHLSQTVVSAHTYTLHHHPKHFTNPSTFDPCRWLKGVLQLDTLISVSPAGIAMQVAVALIVYGVLLVYHAGGALSLKARQRRLKTELPTAIFAAGVAEGERRQRARAAAPSPSPPRLRVVG